MNHNKSLFLCPSISTLCYKLAKLQQWCVLKFSFSHSIPFIVLVTLLLYVFTHIFFPVVSLIIPLSIPLSFSSHILPFPLPHTVTLRLAEVSMLPQWHSVERFYKVHYSVPKNARNTEYMGPCYQITIWTHWLDYFERKQGKQSVKPSKGKCKVTKRMSCREEEGQELEVRKKVGEEANQISQREMRKVMHETLWLQSSTWK